MNRIHKIYFSIILVTAVILRLIFLDSVPPALNWDEVAIGWNANSIWESRIDEYGKRLPLSFQSYGDFKAPLYIYGTAPFIGIFGMNAWSVRIPSALAGILTVVVVYLLAKEIGTILGIKKERIQLYALLSMALTALSPWHLMFSRGAYEANVALFFVTTGLWLFFVSLNKPKLYFFSGLSFVLSLYTYHSPKIYLLLLLPTMLIFFHKKIFTGIMKTKLISVIALLLLITASAPVVYENLKGKGAERIGASVLFQDGEVRKFDLELVGDIASNFQSHLTPAFYINGSTRNLRNTLQDYGLMPTIQLIFLVVGILYLIKIPKDKTKYALFLMLMYLLALVPGALSRGLEVPHNLRTLNALPAITLISVYGLMFASAELSKVFNKHKKPNSINQIYTTVASLYLFSLGFYFYEYYIQYPIYAAKSWQYGYDQAVTIAREYEDQVEQVKITTEYGQPHIFTYFYQNRSEKEIRWGGAVKYHFNTINWEGDQYLSNRLLIGSPKEIPEDIPEDKGEIIKEIYFPDGEVAFRIVKTF